MRWGANLTIQPRTEGGKALVRVRGPGVCPCAFPVFPEGGQSRGTCAWKEPALMLRESICRLVGVLKHPEVGPRARGGFQDNSWGSPHCDQVCGPCGLREAWSPGWVARGSLGTPKPLGSRPHSKGSRAEPAVREEETAASSILRLNCVNNCRNIEMRKD